VAWTRAWGAIVLSGGLLGYDVWSGAFDRGSPWRLAALLTCLAAFVVVDGALYRLALGTGKPGPGGLQWGRPEWRLSAVLLLSAVFLSVLGLLAFVVILAFAFGLASAGHGFILALPMTWSHGVDARARLAMALVAGAAFAALAWAAARLSFGPAASVAMGQIQVLASWPKTRGMVLGIVVGRVVIAVGALGIAGGVVFAAARSFPQSPPVLALASVIAGLCVTGGALPLSAGFLAHLYNRQSS
jgi:hypothetical protein